MKQGRDTRIYFAPFHAAVGDPFGSACGAIIADFKRAVRLQDWPYDNGDDPSFYAMHKFRGQLSWGVCRQEVRNQVLPDDIVVFFAFRKFKSSDDSEYRLCGLATVERKVRQTDLWEKPNLRTFRRYFNLLIRPSKSHRGAWEHFEATVEGSRVHHDWLWRIADHRGLRKQEFEKLEMTDRLGAGATIRGSSVAVAPNYVLFSADPAKTHVLRKPPVIAEHSKGKAAEEWKDDKFSQAVKRLTLDVAEGASGRKRSLRIKNSQRAHRHVVFELPRPDAERWRANFLDLISRR